MSCCADGDILAGDRLSDGSDSAGRPWSLPHWQAMGIVAVLAVSCYANSLGNGFHYDDIHTIVENYLTRTLDAGRVLTARPARFVTKYSFSMSYALARFDRLWVWHSTNVLAHVLCGLLVYGLALRVRVGKEPRLAALAVGLLFVSHPLCTEPVNYQ